MLPTLVFLAAPSPAFIALDTAYFGFLPAVKAETAAGKTAWFMIDTGAPTSVYNGSLAPGWKGPSLQIGKARLTIPTTENHEHDGQEIRGSNLDSGAKVEGEVGIDFLKSRQIFFDPYHRKVSIRTGPALDPKTAERLLRAADPRQRGRGLAKLSLEPMPDGYYGVRGPAATGKTVLVFDTGSTFLALRRELSLAAGGREVFTDPAGSGASMWLLPTVAVGSIRIPLPTVMDLSEEGLDGLVGLSQLARTAILDLPGRKLYYLQPTTSSDIADEALSRLVGRPLWRTMDGKLAVDIAPFTGSLTADQDAMVLTSVQGKPVADLLGLISRATKGDPKSIDDLAAIEQSRWKSPIVQLLYRGKTLLLTFPVM